MKHLLYALGAVLCWASLPAATGSGLDGLDVPELMFFSFVSAAIFLFVQDLLINRKVVLAVPNWRVVLLGVWGIFCYHFIYYEALHFAPLAEGAILATTWSFWIVFFSSILLFKRLKLSILCAALVGMAGVVLVIAAGKELTFSRVYFRGYLLALLCGLIWSSFSVALGRLSLKNDPMTFFTIVAAVLSGLLYLGTMPHQLPPARALASALYLGCVPLGLSFFLWNRALNGGNMVMIGFLSYLAPPLAVLLVGLIHHQHIPLQVIAGMLLIIGASLLGRFFMDRQQEIQKRQQASDG